MVTMLHIMGIAQMRGLLLVPVGSYAQTDVSPRYLDLMYLPQLHARTCNVHMPDKPMYYIQSNVPGVPGCILIHTCNIDGYIG